MGYAISIIHNFALKRSLFALRLCNVELKITRFDAFYMLFVFVQFCFVSNNDRYKYNIYTYEVWFVFNSQNNQSLYLCWTESKIYFSGLVAIQAKLIHSNWYSLINIHEAGAIYNQNTHKYTTGHREYPVITESVTYI